MIDELMLKEMTKFYLKELFYNIPEIPVHIEDELDGESLGQFILDEGEDYDPEEDELMNAFEYRSRYRQLWNGFGGVELARERSYMDPLNHPETFIQINRKLTKDLRKTTAVLLHELLHYAYWYMGREFHDDSRDFLDKCLEMRLPTNYTDFKWTNRGWKNTYDYSKVDKYIEMFRDYLEETEGAA